MQQTNIKHVYITSIIVCILLWLIIYKIPDYYPKSPYYESDSQEDQQCTPATFHIGEWIYDPSSNMLPKYHCIKKKFAHRCYQRLSEPEEIDRSRQIMNYRWKPSQCQLQPFDNDLVADHLLQNPVLFVGDSITQLQFESLSCLLGHRFGKREVTVNGGNPRIRVNEIGDANKTAVAYIRSDYLLRVNDFKVMEPFDSAGAQLGSGENHPWVHAIPNFKYIVINTGPHWHPHEIWGPNRSEDELLSAFEKAMIQLYNYLKDNVRQDQTVWIRTTPHGHANCSQYTIPQSTPIAPSGKPGEYEWHLFKEFDSIWKNIIQRDNDARFQIFDVALMTNKRGDAHSRPDKDCLHTCIPGPVDYWNMGLFSFI
ncbi:hypothetical protein CU097_002252 [Rhizopus azygosporus]|uniref:Trichome birefringence-like C-terminal domain-containing protein n=1 Tax=Rhizopus azygosporus TaxID=86630 RepID=A0A367J8X7_RHIAZ|nr:hypothetical protein CU097_002252 [Rhizopus azygosporus]